MKLSAKVQYAYKAVLELAWHYKTDKKPLQLGAISQRQQIPKKFLVQILLQLKDFGIVGTARGVTGGYYLARHPAQVTIADVFKAVDRNILENSRLLPKTESERLIYSLWEDVNGYLTGHLQVSFEDLVMRLQGMQLNYQI